MALNPFGGGFNLPRILGIRVRIDYSWFVVFALLLWTLAEGYFPQAYPGQEKLTYWGMGLVSAVLLFVSVLIHELSHAVVARRYGLPVPGITLFIFGGVAQLGQEPPGPRAEFWIAAVGPITSILLGGLFLASAELIHARYDIASHTLFYLFVANLVLAGFNLLPGFPLDGGRVLRAWLWGRWANLHRATRAAARAGRLTGAGLMVLGLAQIFLLPGAFVGGAWLMLIGLFLRQAAASSYQMTAIEEMLRDITVGELMHAPPVSVPADLPLDKLVEDFFYRYRFTSFPVERDSELLGLVHINQVKGIPPREWATRAVHEVMSPKESLLVVAPEDPAIDVFRQMSQTGMSKVPVVEGGHLVGLVAVRDILQLFRIKSHLLE